MFLFFAAAGSGQLRVNQFRQVFTAVRATTNLTPYDNRSLYGNQPDPTATNLTFYGSRPDFMATNLTGILR